MVSKECLKGAFWIIVSLVAAFLVCSPVPAPAAPSELTLTVLSAWTPPAGGTEIFVKFIERVNKKGAGIVKLKFVGGSEVAPPLEQLELMKKGVFDLNFNTPNYYGGALPAALSVFMADTTCQELRQSGYWNIFDELHRKKAGVTALGTLWRGENFALFLKKPIQTADLRGQKIRITPLLFNFVEKLGGVYVTMSFSETYLAIQKGVVDGALLPMALTLDSGIHEVAKNIITPLLPCVTDGPLLANASRWDALPANVKKIIMDTLLEMEPEVVPFYKETNKKLLAKMTANTQR